MHEAFNVYVGSAAEDHWAVVDGVEAVARLKRLYARPDRVLPWDVAVGDSPSEDIQAIRLVTTRRGLALPEIVNACPQLRYLQVPATILGQIQLTGVPASLETLVVAGSGAKLAKGVTFSSLRRFAAVDSAIRFSKSTFPVLESLSTRTWAPADQLACAIQELPRLQALAIGPVGRNMRIADVVTPQLRYLRISGGQATALDGLGRLRNLTNLWLHDLPKLEGLEGILELPSLRELSITYCKGIRGVGGLLQVGTLRRMLISGCGDVGLSSVRQQLEGHLDELRVAGTV